jgi:hypothetical protein
MAPDRPLIVAVAALGAFGTGCAIRAGAAQPLNLSVETAALGPSDRAPLLSAGAAAGK